MVADKVAVLYDGDIELHFNEAKHVYTVDGKPVPGCTTILQTLNKPALVPWAVKMTAEYMKEHAVDGMSRAEIRKLADESKKAYRDFTDNAADIGTAVHAYAENKLLGREAVAPEGEAAQNGIRAFHEWFDNTDIECIASEQMLFSKNLYFCGTADFYGRINGELCVADFKTSGGIYSSMLLQTAAYQLALEEMFQDHIQARYIIRLDKKTGECEVARFPHNEGHLQAFRALRVVHREMTRIKEEYGL